MTSVFGFSNEVPFPNSTNAKIFNSPGKSSQKIERDIASRKFPMLTYAQIQKMPSQDVYRYYKKLYALMAELEKFQRLDKKSDKVAALLEQMFLNTSHAGSETPPPYSHGNDCLIGGYWGTWTYRRDIPGIANKNGMTCISENRCALPGDEGNTLSGHKCNPKYFTYENAPARGAWCVNLKKDLTTNGCIALLEKRYSEMCDTNSNFCRPFADHFKRSILEAIAADAKYSGISEEQAISQYRDEVFTEFERIRQYCGDTKAEWDRHSAGQEYSCFRLMNFYEQLEQTVTEIAPPPALPPPVIYTPTNNNGLGPYACIKQGLINAGYNSTSNKYIAMFAVRAKEQADTTFSIFRNAKGRQRASTKATILSIASVGICSGSGPTAQEASVIDSWLSSDKLKNLNRDQYYSMFGLERQHAIPHTGWDKYSSAQRRNLWDQVVKNEYVRSCPKKLPVKESIRVCKMMHKACGYSNTSACSQQAQEDNDNDSDDSSRPPGGGGGSGGSTSGGSSTSEAGNGSNAESHAADRSGGQGTGP